MSNFQRSITNVQVALNSPATPKGENIVGKVENRLLFPEMFSPLGVGGKDKRRPEMLKLMAMPSHSPPLHFQHKSKAMPQSSSDC